MLAKITMLTFLLGSSVLAQEKLESCKVLALSGGGSNGAWESGVIWGLMHYGNPEDFEWDVVSGVSAGAINSGGVALWPKDQGVQMSEWLDFTWQTMQQDDLFTKWLGGYAAVLWKPSLLNDEPGVKYLGEILANFTETGAQRDLIVSTLDVEYGIYVNFTTWDFPYERFNEYIFASASIPMVFQPRHIDDHYYVDGGTVWNTNIASGINRCFEKTGDYSKITIDMANTDAYHLDQLSESSHNALENYLRRRNIHHVHKKTNDILEVKRAFPEVNYRYYFQPSGERLNGLDELRVTNETTWRINEMGREDAKAALEKGPGFAFDVLEQYHFNKDVQEEHGTYAQYFRKMFGFTS